VHWQRLVSRSREPSRTPFDDGVFTVLPTVFRNPTSLIATGARRVSEGHIDDCRNAGHPRSEHTESCPAGTIHVPKSRSDCPEDRGGYDECEVSVGASGCFRVAE
jgi:hypothetical protein